MAKILVVDDESRDLLLMEALLLPLGYEVMLAHDGEEALEKAVSKIPDLILLDIMMPKMNGYEAARRLQEDERTKEIPIIFITAKTEVADEVKGFELGGVDYITKPVSAPIVRVRVKTHLALKRQNEILKENMQLRDDIELITRHDLKAPLHGIINFPMMVQSKGNLTEKQQMYLKKTVQLGYKMLDMINLSLDLYKMEQGIYQFQPVPVNVLPIFNEIVAENVTLIDAKKLSVRITLNGEPLDNGDEFIVAGEQLLLYSMLSNIFNNALEASPECEQITITLEKKKTVKISIHNQGSVPVDIRDRFFEKYVTADKSRGTGLGTYSARLIAEIQEGTVRLETSETEGTRVIFSFPN